jgi:flagellar protein FlaG
MDASMVANNAPNITPITPNITPTTTVPNRPKTSVTETNGATTAPQPVTEPRDVPTPMQGRMIPLNVLSENDITDSLLGRAVVEANKALELKNTFSLSYEVHDDTNQVMVRVYDSNTEEVIREIPPESKLDTLAKILDFAGLIVDVRS